MLIEKQKALEKARRKAQLLELQQKKRQETKLKHEAFLKRKYEQHMKKITPTLHSDYSNSPIQPGFLFFESLFSNPRVPVKNLELNIPEMLYVLNSRTAWAYTQAGKLRVDYGFSRYEVYKRFEGFKKEDSEVIAMLRMQTDSPQDLKAHCMTWKDFSERVMKGSFPSKTIMQRYVRAHSERPCVTRLFYIHNTKLNKPSYAFNIVNSVKAMEKYTQAKHLLCSELVDGIEVYPLKGPGVKDYCEIAAKVVEFLERGYWIRIDSITFDFIRDSSGTPWLLSCKGFKLDTTVKFSKEVEVKNSSMSYSRRKAKLEELRDQRLSSVECKLCLLQFQAVEISHTLPYKMLLGFKRHTEKSRRNILQLNHIRPIAVDFQNHWVRVCNDCYMLVLTEHELMETEEKLAGMMNVPTENENFTSLPSFDHPAFLPTKSLQWRVLLYFKDLESPNHDLELSELKAKLWILDQSYTLELKPCNFSSKKAKLKTLKLFYFFCSERNCLRQLCKGEKLQIEVKVGSSQPYSGHCYPLANFGCSLPEKTAITQPLDVMLFNNSNTLSVKMYSGIACDFEVNPRLISSDIFKYKGVYKPVDSYFSTQPLPKEWMELFDSNYHSDISVQVKSSFEVLQESYTPILKQKEILCPSLCSGKVLHQSKPQNSSQVKTQPSYPSKKNTHKLNLSLKPASKVASPSSRSSRTTLPRTSSAFIVTCKTNTEASTIVPLRLQSATPKTVRCFKKGLSQESLRESDVLGKLEFEQQLVNTVSNFLSKRGVETQEATKSKKPRNSKKEPKSKKRSKKPQVKRKDSSLKFLKKLQAEKNENIISTYSAECTFFTRNLNF